MTVRVTAFRPFERNSLRGFATVEFGSLIVHDVTVHQRDGQRWVGLPARPMLDADKHPIFDDQGRLKYAKTLEWATPEAAAQFKTAVLAALDAYLAGGR